MISASHQLYPTRSLCVNSLGKTFSAAEGNLTAPGPALISTLHASTLRTVLGPDRDPGAVLVLYRRGGRGENCLGACDNEHAELGFELGPPSPTLPGLELPAAT